MGDPWQHVLEALEPTYYSLKKMIEQGPEICADLSRRGRDWCITLQEQPLPHGNTPVWADSGKIDERVNWAVDQLREWPYVRRMAHDMWYFKRKRDAEKFKTLYNLVWGTQ